MEGVLEEEVVVVAEVELHPLKMEALVEIWRPNGAVEVEEEPVWDLCWVEEEVVGRPCLVWRVEVEEGQRWALWIEEVEEVLLGLWREVGAEEQSCGEVEEVERLLWKVEAEEELVVAFRF